jgi:hypothetical protein
MVVGLVAKYRSQPRLLPRTWQLRIELVSSCFYPLQVSHHKCNYIIVNKIVATSVNRNCFLFSKLNFWVKRENNISHCTILITVFVILNVGVIGISTAFTSATISSVFFL